MLEVTQATIKDALLSGEPLRLVGEFTNVSIPHTYSTPLVLEAHKALIKGLEIAGSNVIMRGGAIQATGGYEGFARAGYGALVSGKKITFENVSFDLSNRCVVANGTEDLSIRYCSFSLGQDGVIASRGKNLDISYNEFLGVYTKPTLCRLPDGSTIDGLSQRDCTARGGAWRDGFHQDAVQLRNGIDNITLIGNFVYGITQGLVQMDSPADLPLTNVYIDGNDVSVTGFHSITMSNKASGVTMVRNRIRQLTGRKTLLRHPPGTILYDNDVPVI